MQYLAVALVALVALAGQPDWQQLKKESRDDSQVHLHENIRDQARAEIRDCCW